MGHVQGQGRVVVAVAPERQSYHVYYRLASDSRARLVQALDDILG